MATSTSTWTTGISADWSVAAAWTPALVPDSAEHDVLIAAVPASGTTYSVAILAQETFTAASVTLADPGAVLDIAGLLRLNGGHVAVTAGQVTLSGGTLNNLGTLVGLLEGRGTLNGSSPLINQGTIANDGGNLFILAPFTNAGTVITEGTGGGFLGIQGSSLSNLSGGTLTGGSYIARGSGNAFNILGIAIGASSRIVTNAAHLVLDGPASDIRGFNNGTFESIALSLQTIAAGGTLELLGGRDFETTNPLLNAGLVRLEGGSLSTGSLAVVGTLEGFGLVSGVITNTGLLNAKGGVLNITSQVDFVGSIAVSADARMIMKGGSPDFLTVDGTLFQTQGLLEANDITGAGTLVVENGATLRFITGREQTVQFGGANATFVLADPQAYTGTLVDFGPGDSWFGPDRLVMWHVPANAATDVNGNSLVVTNDGTTVQTFALAGDYTGATFSVVRQGEDTIITPLSGTPARDGLDAVITVTDQAGVDDTLEGQILGVLDAAINDWGQYITGHAPLRVHLTIAGTTNGSILAEAGFAGATPTGQVIAGQDIWMPASIHALTTGTYIQGTTADINMTLFAGGANLTNLFIDPTPATEDPIPALQFDLRTVFRHEMGHGLGFSGFTNVDTGIVGNDITLFDYYIQSVLDAGSIEQAVFTGPYAQAAYAALLGTGTATPVPLTTLNNGQALFHLANASTDPLGQDLMNGIGIATGTSYAISAIDLAMLRDVGVPVTAGIVCFARGTRIRTTAGDVPVESLATGDIVITADGRREPIIWIGRRHVDCTRHPEPTAAWPIRIRAGAFARGVPERDLFVSPNHALSFQDVLIPARLLQNKLTVQQVEVGEVEYFHVELPRHCLLLAEGLAAESYLDCGDRGIFPGNGPVIPLHPGFASQTWEAGGCAELKLVGPEVTAARKLLLRRGVAATRQASPRRASAPRRAPDRPTARVLSLVRVPVS